MLLLAFGLVQPPPRAAALHLQARILRAALVGCTRNEMHGAGCTRRGLLGACLGMMPAAALARTPGSEDVGEAVQQIEDAAAALKKLRSEWSSFAVIDAEGRAGNIDAARRILGGVAPQRGDAARIVAEQTPLYRVDNAFAAVRKGALNGAQGWADDLDLEAFVEAGERIVFDLKKADDSFYGVVFASKGTSQLQGLYDEAGKSVDRSIREFDNVIALLRAAKVPGA
jgi:hypothetical protein